MALTTPIAVKHDSFDKVNITRFYFTSNGGNQVVKNRLTIRNNVTNVVVYQNTLETFAFYQDLLANTLTNGVYYNFYFNTYDIDDNMSADSNSMPFYCYTTPTITYTNAPSSHIIEASSFTFDVTYNQIEGELLGSLLYELRDTTGTTLATSGNLYATTSPPNDFSYMFSGFENNTYYYVHVEAVASNNVDTTNVADYEFTTSYLPPEIFNSFVAENDCENGAIKLESNLVIGEGTVSPSPALFRSDIMDGNEASYIMWDTWYTPVNDVISVWAERHALEMTDQSKVLTFDNGFTIPSDFQHQLWLNPSMDGEMVYMYKTGNETNRLIVELKSGIPTGESTVKNWFEIYTEDGNLFDYSNYVSAMKIDTKFIVWFKKVGTTYNLLLDIVSVGSGTLISWDGTDVYPTARTHNNIDSLFPMDVVKMRNGVFENFDITSNTNRVYSQAYPVWDYYTKINCNFSDLNIGNADIILSQTQALKIKRRLSGTFNWITLYTIDITSVADLNILKEDCCVPTGKTFDYAVVPILSDGSEGNYIISNVTTNFRWCYLCDGDTILKFYSNCSYPTITSNPTGGLYVPIGRKYPITVFNAENDYETGSFSGNILGTNFLTTRQINRADVQTQLSTYKAFINNKKSKTLKDWDGRIKIVDTNIGGNLEESVDLISGKANLTFQWVEKGDWNTQQDLYDNGLVDTLS